MSLFYAGMWDLTFITSYCILYNTAAIDSHDDNNDNSLTYSSSTRKSFVNVLLTIYHIFFFSIYIKLYIFPLHLVSIFHNDNLTQFSITGYITDLVMLIGACTTEK